MTATKAQFDTTTVNETSLPVIHSEKSSSKEPDMNINKLQIENSFLLGPFHLIKLLSFFYPTNVNWRLIQLWTDMVHLPCEKLCQWVLPMSIASRTEYIFRNPASLAVPKCSKSRRLATFLPATIFLWNSLPSFTLSSSSPGSFLQLLDSHFQSDCFSFGLP